MEESQEEMLEEYREYLLELANNKSEEIFTNGGLSHASILMSVLLSQTNNKACFFSEGFSSEVIREPYLSALKSLLNKKNIEIKILLESDAYINENPMALIRHERDCRTKEQGAIEVRLIKEEDKKHIYNELKCERCNFSVFDQNMCRFEYDPQYFKAYGSFNNTANSKFLCNLFDKAFQAATVIN